MPITVHCPHDKAELDLKKDEKTPDGLLKCPKCGCTFRVCLAIFNGECYVKMHPNSGKVGEGKKPRKEKSKWVGGPMQEIPEEVVKGEIVSGFPVNPNKRKRGRPTKKVEENAT